MSKNQSRSLIRGIFFCLEQFSNPVQTRANNHNHNLFYSHYSGTKVKKKNENTRNYRKRIDRNYITICTIFESVCNSQSSKAFELAAAYLQVKKGTKSRSRGGLT